MPSRSTKNQHAIDGGVPASPDRFAEQSAVAIAPTHLVLQSSGAKCTPVWPHNIVRANTIFAVAHAHHLRTAWSDKHPAYDIVNGNDPDSQPNNGPGTNVR